MADMTELSPGEVREVEEAPQEKEWQENLNINIICPNCNETPPNLVDETSSGDLVCGDCGMVLESNVVDTRSEWRNFSNDDQNNDDPSRVGQAGNALGLETGTTLKTEVQFDQKSAIARELSRAHAKASEDKGGKQQNEAFQTIENICQIRGWPRLITDCAKQLYQLAMRHKAFRNKPQDSIIAGVIFIACRQGDNARTFKEIAKLTGVPKKEVGKIFKQLESHFLQVKKKTGGKGTHEINGYKETSRESAPDMCHRFGAALGLSNSVSIRAGESAVLLNSAGVLAGRSPLSIAAVALYAISNFMGEPRSAKEVGKACEVSDGTIKAAWKKIYDQREKIIDKAWLQQGGDIEKLPPA